MIWSMIANVGVYVAVSLSGSQTAEEHRQASVFVDVFRRRGRRRALLARHGVGAGSAQRARALSRRAGGRHGASPSTRAAAACAGRTTTSHADAEFVHFVETQLAGAIGAASARVMVASAVKEEALTLDEVREILDEASQVVVYSHQLEQKSHELEAATAELRAANERLQELDRLKDDFISTVTHELRTPLTSIRAFSEILLDDPKVDLADSARNFSASSPGKPSA